MVNPRLENDAYCWLERRFGTGRVLLSLREVAEALDMQPSSLRRAVAERRSDLPMIKLHGRYRMSIDEFAHWLAVHSKLSEGDTPSDAEQPKDSNQ